VHAALERSVVLITSRSDEIPQFGSGFAVHQDESSTYLITCAHVIEDVGGADKVRVGAIPATVIALGKSNGCDLAILKVHKQPNIEILRLSSPNGVDHKVIIMGYSQNETKVKALRRIDGKLEQKIFLELDGERTPAWDLKIEEQSRYVLQPGYSGSPVVDATTGLAVGVVTQMKDLGRNGMAIASTSIKQIWKAAPNETIQAELDRLYQALAFEETVVSQSNQDISEIETYYLKNRGNQLFTASLSWLSSRNQIASRVGEESLKQLEIHDKRIVRRFCSEIEMYLELVYYSLIGQRLNLLHEPVIHQSLRNPDLYANALTTIRQRIPQDIIGKEREKLEEHLDYLVSRIS
jgi:Trypsin-like peptidase domain